MVVPTTETVMKTHAAPAVATSYGIHALISDMILPMLLFVVGFKLCPLIRRRSVKFARAVTKPEPKAAETSARCRDGDAGVSIEQCSDELLDDWEVEYACDWSPVSPEGEHQVSPEPLGHAAFHAWSDFASHDDSTTGSASDSGRSLRADDEDWFCDDEFLAEGSICSGPQAIVEADVGSALDAALASGDVALAEPVLLAGARLCGVQWLAKACGKLREVGLQLSIPRGVEFVKIFETEGRPDLAVDLWHNVCMDKGEEPSAIDISDSAPEGELYGAVLEACVSCGDFEAAARVARSASWRAPAPVHETAQKAMLALARWLARRRAIGPAMECYDSIRRTGAPVDLPTHRAMLKACVSGNDMMRASVLFQDLIDSGGVPDFPIYSAMIHGCRAAGRSEEALSYFERMKRQGIQPDASLFHTLLDSCVWRDVPALVEQVMADMEEARVTPSAGTLSTVLKLYGRSCNIAESLEAFEDLPRRHGFQVDSRAYTTMISTCLQAGRLDLALEVFDRMTSAGYRPKAKIYEALLNASMRRGDLDRAVRLVDSAIAYQAPPQEEQEADVSDQPDMQPTPVVVAAAVDGMETARSPPPRRMQAHARSLRLEQSSIESLLQLVGRRQEAARLGVPLLTRLRAAGVSVSESIGSALEREAARGAPSGRGLGFQERHNVFQQWRDFRHP